MHSVALLLLRPNIALSSFYCSWFPSYTHNTLTLTLTLTVPLTISVLIFRFLLYALGSSPLSEPTHCFVLLLRFIVSFLYAYYANPNTNPNRTPDPLLQSFSLSATCIR